MDAIGPFCSPEEPRARAENDLVDLAVRDYISRQPQAHTRSFRGAVYSSKIRSRQPRREGPFSGRVIAPGSLAQSIPTVGVSIGTSFRCSGRKQFPILSKRIFISSSRVAGAARLQKFAKPIGSAENRSLSEEAERHHDRQDCWEEF